MWSSTVTLGNVLASIGVTVGVGFLLWRLFHRLSDSLRGLVVDANDSVAGVNAALTRLEMLETRLNATEHRLSVIERYQIRVLDAEATARGAGIEVPRPHP